ncbi:MAG: FAD-dependent oxidoreductase [Dehalococcoidia bacterium]
MVLEPWLPARWDVEADVVVVGFGAAGAATAITACELGASVVLLEKAPKGEEGGNTRVAGQGYLNISDTKLAIDYLKAMNGPFAVPDEMLQVWAEEMAKNNDWVASIGGDPQEHQPFPAGIEFPEFPGAESIHKYHHGDVLGYSNTWLCFERAVEARAIDVRYETPARELIQHGITKEILGVRAERDGRPLYVKARRGVALTCGGFENNQEMIRTYLPAVPYCYPSGTPYNQGDGIQMALTVGADLWHMNNYAGPSMALKVPEYPSTFSMTPLNFGRELPGGMVVVGPDGTRFTDEKGRTSHGKVRQNGWWGPLTTPCPMHMIFDHALLTAAPLYDKEPNSGWTRVVTRYDWSADNSAELARGWIRRAGTIEALAALIDVDAATLAATIERWNALCAGGADTDFGRTKMLVPFRDPPYYAVELSPAMLNTQGGPRRNERAQIVRPDGSPIPRLYSSGELGSIYGYLYQGTGNIGECLAFGRIAGRNAVAERPWD